jgi:Glycosyl transferases group 1
MQPDLHQDDGRETLRRSIENRARLLQGIDRYRAERAELAERLDRLAAGSGPGRRLAGAVAGSLAWDRAARLVRAWRGGATPSGPGDLRRTHREEREAFERLARRVRIHERGAGELLRATLRGLPRGRQAGRGARRWPRLLPGGIPIPTRARGTDSNVYPTAALIVHAPLPGGVVAAIRIARRTSYPGLRVVLVPRTHRGGDRLASCIRRRPEELVAVCSAGSPTERDWLERAAAAFRDDPALGLVAGGWMIDWVDGAPRALPPAPTPIVTRRHLIDSDTLVAYDGALWAMDLALEVEARGLRLEPVTGWTAGGTREVASERDTGTLAGRWGSALRRLAFEDLLRGGGSLCSRPAAVRLEGGAEELTEHCRALGWSVGSDAPDLTLSAAGGDATRHLAVDWAPVLGALPAVTAASLEELTDGLALRGVLLRALQSPTVCLRLAARDEDAARSGGDRHLALPVARELRARGHQVVVQTRAEEAVRAGLCLDVVVDVRGRELAPPGRGRLNLLWNVSHPEDVHPEELERYDRVLVASRRYAAELAQATAVSVAPLLQCTDPRLFRPRPGSERSHDVLFLGNWRSEFRRIVFDAIATGHPVALYGRGWQYLEPESHVAEHVAPERLAGLYSSCKVLLNDHWDDMRERGFVSNRVFDALACEAFVISDQVPGIEDELDGGLVTYSDADDLRAKLDRYLDDEAGRGAIARRGRDAVMARHTVAIRTEELLRQIAHAARETRRPPLRHLAAD